MTVTQDIRTALEVQLKTVATLPTNPSTGDDNVAWENRHFTVAKGETYVRLDLDIFQQRPASAGVTAPDLHRGVLLIDVFVPEDKGPFDGDELADEIIAVFDPHANPLVFNGRNVRIEFAERTNAIANPPFYLIPVRIGWFSFV